MNCYDQFIKMEQVEKLWKESGYPAAGRLYALAKSQGVTGITQQKVKEFIDKQEVSQLHRKAPIVAETPITVSGANVEYQMDLLDMSAYSRNNEGNRWCLIVEDIWDRRAVAIPCKTKSPEDVQPALVQAFKEIGEKPVQIVSDSGTEWMGKVKAYLDNEKIVHRMVEVGDHRSLGIIDSFARFMKNAIHKHFTHTQKTDWISYLPTLINAYNNTPHIGLKAKDLPAMSPNEAHGLETDTRNIHLEKVHAAQAKRKPSELQVGDYVRVLKHKQTFDRGYEVRYSKEVYRIEQIDGQWYVLSNEKRYRAGSLRKSSAPKAAEEEQPTIRDVAREAKFEHKTEQILKHKEGVSQSNRREGLRERAPASQLENSKYGRINW